MTLIPEIRSGLAAAGDAERAKAQQAYMKSAMPYAGVLTPEMRKIVRALVRTHPIETRDAWHDTVMTLWREANVREERYAATEIAAHRAYAGYALDPASLTMYEEMIVTGAWWDHVDAVATVLVGPLLPGVTSTMRAWSTDADMWKRRTSIICQVGRGADVDTRLLADAITANIAEKDFFLRKAIGWGLRQHARVDPHWVRAFVGAHPELSGLSRREALRHLGTV